MATIPTYKRQNKIALACCRMAQCDKLVDGKCVATTKEECAIENAIEELPSHTHAFVRKIGRRDKMNAYDYVSKYNGYDLPSDAYKNEVCVRIIFGVLRKCREAIRLEEAKVAFWKEHEMERVWEKSYREMKGLGKYGYWIHEDTCFRCPNQFDGKCLKYSDERLCEAEEYCKKWNTELSKRGHELAYHKERAAHLNYLRSIDDSTVEGFYATSELRGGWCGD